MNSIEAIPELTLPVPPLAIEMAGAVRLCCPDDLRLMTPYVLSEQGDWFEDEIKFLRSLLGPADRVVDIGANYGVYSLTAAKICTQGAVWAFEPCAGTAAHLRASAVQNDFANLHVIQAAMSDKSGRGFLATNANAELNAIAVDADASGEPICLTTLDEEMALFGPGEIDFLKIDAEGHEQEVIRGATKFLESFSPLVMIEVKAGTTVNLGPLRMLEGSGYAPYRLVRGLNALVPFQAGEQIDGYQLNLFCCKADRARRIEALGRLVLISPADVVSDSEPADMQTWETLLARYPYGQKLNSHWLEQIETNSLSYWPNYEAALNFWVRAQASDISMLRRWRLLQSAFGTLSGVVGSFATVPRLLSLVRIAADLGAREVAVAALSQLREHVRDSGQCFLGEPFLLPTVEFESVAPGENVVAWTTAAILDGFEQMRAFSSYFSPKMTLEIGDEMAHLGYPSAIVERRSRLARIILN
jgi:FkbM family methyltransferase